MIRFLCSKKNGGEYKTKNMCLPSALELIMHQET